jgi:ankyrin repeat protein
MHKTNIFVCRSRVATETTQVATQSRSLKTINIDPSYELSNLHRAILKGSHGEVARLIGEDVDVNQKGYEGCTALHICADLDDRDIALLLLSHGANVDEKDCKKRTPMTYAIEARSAGVGELLLFMGSPMKPISTWVIYKLRAGMDAEDKEFAKKLLGKARTLTGRSDAGQYILRDAIQARQPLFVKLLLNVGFDVDEPDDDGKHNHQFWQHTVLC